MKVNNTKGTTSVSKNKKSGKSKGTSSVSFDAMVDALTGAERVDSTAATSATSSVSSVDSDASSHSSYVPSDAKGRGGYMLDNLEQLEKDILSGSASDAVEKLKTALETEVVDMDKISPKLQKILDEIEMRASVEVAKMEAAGPNNNEEEG